jgi:YidC/Oxa1 family membrane protein insertase
MTFRYRDQQRHVEVEKRLTFHHGTYAVDLDVRTEGLGSPLDVTLGTNFGIVEWGEGFIGLMGPASSVDDKVLKEMPEGEVERKGDVEWSAIQDKYFLSVLMPKKQAVAAVAKKEGDKLASAGVRFNPPASGATMSMQLYAGPKEYDTLKSFNLGLEDTIDFGWFIFGSWSLVKGVAKPIFYILRFLYDYTHNYGVTIILLTVMLKLMFAPLQYKSYKSMKQMQMIQPKVLAVQNKFKDDRERLNKELIKLYKDHKVNPVGGCLPMVLQMPVFVALFNILYMTIDLRQAPFMLWIKDLSVQDPYYVLPIIMGVTMVIQQKITPTTMDPTQAKIMLFMPVFMTFLFLNFAAGLVLYWLTNNVLTITQQVVTERLFAKHWKVPGAESEAPAR